MWCLVKKDEAHIITHRLGNYDKSTYFSITLEIAGAQFGGVLGSDQDQADITIGNLWSSVYVPNHARILQEKLKKLKN